MAQKTGKLENNQELVKRGEPNTTAETGKSCSI